MLHTNYQKWDVKNGHKLQTVIRLLREVPTRGDSIESYFDSTSAEKV